MAIIEKKCWQESFEAILCGEKNYEIRLADFNVQKGDILLLREYDPLTKKYTGREIKKEVLRVGLINDCEKYYPKEEIKKHGFQVIGLKN
jgi:hypothetical protein